MIDERGVQGGAEGEACLPSSGHGVELSLHDGRRAVGSVDDVGSPRGRRRKRDENDCGEKGAHLQVLLGGRCEEGGGERALAQFPWEPEQKRARRVQYEATVLVLAPVWPREPLGDRGPHHDQVVLVPRDAAGDEQQIVLRDHVHDRQVLDRAPVDSHLPRHALVLEHAPWRLALTDRAGVAMHLVRGGAVSRRTLHMVALHHALEPVTAGSARHVDLVALLEQLDGDLAADGVISELLVADAELLHEPVRLEVLLLVDARVGLACPLRTLLVELAVRELEGGVSVAIRGTVSEYEVRGHLDDGDADRGSVFAEDGGHSDLLADDALGHGNSCSASRIVAPTTALRRRVGDREVPEVLLADDGRPAGSRYLARAH